MTPRHAKPSTDRPGADAPPTESAGPNGPGSTIGERITGVRDAKDVDGLLTLGDLPDPTGDVSDLHDLLPRATRYGDQPGP